MLIEKVHAFSKTWTAKLLFVLIIVSFVFVGVQGAFFQNPNNPEVVRVGDASVDVRRFEGLLRVELNALGQNQDFESLPTPVRARVIAATLEKAVQRATLLDATYTNSLEIDTGVVEAQLLDSPELRDENGTFSADRLRAMLVQNNISEADFIESARQDSLVNWFANSVINSAVMADAAVNGYYDAIYETRSGYYMALDSAAFAETITPATQDVLAYYTANKQRFLSDERVRVEYILLTADDIAVDDGVLSEQAVQNAYGQYVQDAMTRRTYKVRHILLSEEQGNVAARSEQIIKALAEQSFAEVASQFSDDTLSAEDGGLLGEITLDLLPESLQTVVASMQVGEWTEEPVESEFGQHFLALDSIQEDIKPFFEMEETIRERLVNNAQQVGLQEKYTQLEQKVFLSENIASLTTDAGTNTTQSGWIIKDSAQNTDSFAQNEDVVARLFETEFLEGQNPILVPLDDAILIVQKTEHQPSQEAPLSDVEQEVAEQVRLVQANRTIRDAVQTAVGAANAQYPNQPLPQIARDTIANDIATRIALPVEWIAIDKLARFDTRISGRLTRLVFDASRSRWRDTGRLLVSTNDAQPTQYLAYISEVTAGSFVDAEGPAADAFAQYVTNTSGRDILSLWLKHSAQTKNVIVNQQIFQQQQ